MAASRRSSRLPIADAKQAANAKKMRLAGLRLAGDPFAVCKMQQTAGAGAWLWHLVTIQ